MKTSNPIIYRLTKTTLISAALALSVINATPATEQNGLDIYKNICKSCHGGGMKGWLSGAPKVGKDSAWKEYFVDNLTQIETNILDGSEKHEAMGNKEGLSKNDVAAAIAHMISLTPSLAEKAKQ